MDEVWKEIPGTEYSVSDEGRVASRKFGKWRVMKAGPNSNGYRQVDLHDGSGRRRCVKVHILVAEAFLGPRPTPAHEVNRIDGIRDNPRVDNLEWVTQSGNMRHRYDVLKHGNIVFRGETNWKAKLTEVEVREIIRRCAAGEFQRVVAADFGVCQPTVSMIVAGKRWSHLS